MPIQKNEIRSYPVTGMTINLCAEAEYFIEGRVIKTPARIEVLGAKKKPIEIPLNAMEPILELMASEPKFKEDYQSLINPAA